MLTQLTVTVGSVLHLEQIGKLFKKAPGIIKWAYFPLRLTEVTMWVKSTLHSVILGPKICEGRFWYNGSPGGEGVFP